MSKDNGSGVRDASGQFLPGNTIRGGRISEAALTKALIAPHRRAIVARALRLMRSHDGRDAAAGCNILLTRLSPVPSPEREKVNLPALASAVGFEAKCDVVIAGVANGEISAEAGEKLLRLIDIYRAAVTSDSIEWRLRILEGKDVLPVEHDDGSDLA